MKRPSTRPHGWRGAPPLDVDKEVTRRTADALNEAEEQCLQRVLARAMSSFGAPPLTRCGKDARLAPRIRGRLHPSACPIRTANAKSRSPRSVVALLLSAPVNGGRSKATRGCLSGREGRTGSGPTALARDPAIARLPGCAVCVDASPRVGTSAVGNDASSLARSRHRGSTSGLRPGPLVRWKRRELR